MKNRLKAAFALVAETEIWAAALTAATSIIASSLLPWAVIVSASYWGVRWAAQGKPTRRTPLDAGVVLLILTMATTLWATALPDNTRTQVYRLGLGILLFYAVINWTHSSKRVSLVLAGTLLAGLALAGGAVISVQWATAKLPFIPSALYERFTVLVSDTVHPNVLAGSIILILPLGLSLPLFAWRSRRWGLLLLAGATALVCTAILILTQSRGALLAVLLVAGLLVMLRWRWSWVLAAGATLTAFGLYLAGALPSTATLQAGLASMLGDLSPEGRIEIWSRAIYTIQDFAFTGVGMGSFTEVVDLLYPLFLQAPGKVGHAHNLFLQIAVDLGLPGLIAWLSLLFGVIASAWQLYRFGKRSNDGWTAGLGAGLLGSQCALIIHGLTDAVTWGMVRSAPLVWAIWGLAVAAWLAAKSHSRRILA